MASASTVLLVDDDDALSILLENAIHRSGHDIRLKWVADGADAISYLSRHGEYADQGKYPLPSVLLLDLKMPRVTGFEVLEWKRKQPQLESLPVVIWSSSGLEEDRERSERLGAAGYFVKPLDIKGFVELIDRLRAYEIMSLKTQMQTIGGL